MPKRSANPAAQTKAVIQNQTVSIPTTGKLSTAAGRVKSYVRNILLASPAFPRLYADVVISSAPNSYEAKILARNYQKIVERTSMPNFKNCTHIKVTGVRCGSPALRGEQFCYFHQRMLRTVKGPPASRVHHAALLEDEESIQASLMEIVNALLRGTIELKRAELILRALNTAVRNIRRVHFGLHSADMVKEVPAYPAVPDVEMEEYVRNQAERKALRAEFARQQAAYFAEKDQVGTVPVGAAQVSTAGVGTAAPGCPSGPAVPGRRAVASASDATLPKPRASQTVPEVGPTQRKPPARAGLPVDAPKPAARAAKGAS
jgi:hypothetical protein